MERSGSSDAARAAAPVGALSQLFSSEGPFLTVWAATPGNLDDAEERILARWRSARAEAAAAGAPDVLLDAVEAVHTDAYRFGEGLVVVAASDEVRHVEHLASPPRAELVRWAALPSLSPVIEHRQAMVPHVVVLIDRTGADIVAVSGDGDGDEQADERTVEPGEGPRARVSGRGWSRRRDHQRAENIEEHNASAVAGVVAEAAERIAAELVVVAGDVRAVELLRAALPSAVAALVHEVPGGRAADGSAEETDHEITRMVRTAVAAQTVTVLARYREEVGQDARAAEGAADTVAALSSSQVDVLVVHDDIDQGPAVWFDPAGSQLAMARDDLVAMGIESPAEGRLVDAAVRSALLTGAGVRVVPAHALSRDGIGAILRW